MMPHKTRYFSQSPDDRLCCDLCPRLCSLTDNQRGLCFVRQRQGDAIYLMTYGRSSGFCVDPIEKKPLNHFLPGTPVLSFGTAGCNLTCSFCQNWDMSKSRQMDTLQEIALPDAIAEMAIRTGCRSVAFTYNDPVIFLEYAIDTAKACEAVGIKSVAVTAGYINPIARSDFFENMDAANIDLKAFSEEFYHKHCSASLQPVLDTLVYVANQTETWLEITTLLIPGENDSAEEIRRLCDWILENLGDKVPVHFTAFHPAYKMTDAPRTPFKILKEARQLAMSLGLKYVYTGNVSDKKGASSYCSGCGTLLIAREGYTITDWNPNADGCCPGCGEKLAGLIEESPGDWQSRRLPIHFPRPA